MMRYRDFGGSDLMRLVQVMLSGVLVAAAVAAEPPELLRVGVEDGFDGGLAKLGKAYEKTLSEMQPPKLVRVELVRPAPGRGTAALLEGEYDLLATNKQLKRSDSERLQLAYGEMPVELPMAIRELAVLVAEGNPLTKRGISLLELDALYSPMRKRGYEGDLNRWQDLGFADAPPDLRIKTCGLKTGTTRGNFFRERVLLGGRMTRFAKQFDEGKTLVAHLAAGDGAAIGFGSRKDLRDGVVAVPIRIGERLFLPTEASLQDGSYPLMEAVSFQLRTTTRPEAARFLQFVHFTEGAQILRKAGLTPMPSDERSRQLGLLERLIPDEPVAGAGPSLLAPKPLAPPKPIVGAIGKRPERQTPGAQQPRASRDGPPAPLISPELQRKIDEAKAAGKRR